MDLGGINSYSAAHGQCNVIIQLRQHRPVVFPCKGRLGFLGFNGLGERGRHTHACFGGGLGGFDELRARIDLLTFHREQLVQHPLRAHKGIHDVLRCLGQRTIFITNQTNEGFTGVAFYLGKAGCFYRVSRHNRFRFGYAHEGSHTVANAFHAFIAEDYPLSNTHIDQQLDSSGTHGAFQLWKDVPWRICRSLKTQHSVGILAPGVLNHVGSLTCKSQRTYFYITRKRGFIVPTQNTIYSSSIVELLAIQVHDAVDGCIDNRRHGVFIHRQLAVFISFNQVAGDILVAKLLRLWCLGQRKVTLDGRKPLLSQTKELAQQGFLQRCQFCLGKVIPYRDIAVLIKQVGYKVLHCHQRTGAEVFQVLSLLNQELTDQVQVTVRHILSCLGCCKQRQYTRFNRRRGIADFLFGQSKG